LRDPAIGPGPARSWSPATCGADISAAEAYGVVLNADMTVDTDATLALRKRPQA
jgi:hypothetical protein